MAQTINELVDNSIGDLSLDSGSGSFEKEGYVVFNSADNEFLDVDGDSGDLDPDYTAVHETSTQASEAIEERNDEDSLEEDYEVRKIVVNVVLSDPSVITGADITGEAYKSVEG